MLIHYSVASYELLQRKLSDEEKEEVYDVFYRFGQRMKLRELAPNYINWLEQRKTDMENDLAKSEYTVDLFKQYKKHLGNIRYFILIEGQKLMVPERVRKLLGFKKISILSFVLPFYKLSRAFHLDDAVKKIILPRKYLPQIKEIDFK
jgi:hypothetical protein